MVAIRAVGEWQRLAQKDQGEAEAELAKAAANFRHAKPSLRVAASLFGDITLVTQHAMR